MTIEERRKIDFYPNLIVDTLSYYTPSGISLTYNRKKNGPDAFPRPIGVILTLPRGARGPSPGGIWCPRSDLNFQNSPDLLAPLTRLHLASSRPDLRGKLAWEGCGQLNVAILPQELSCIQSLERRKHCKWSMTMLQQMRLESKHEECEK